MGGATKLAIVVDEHRPLSTTTPRPRPRTATPLVAEASASGRGEGSEVPTARTPATARDAGARKAAPGGAPLRPPSFEAGPGGPRPPRRCRSQAWTLPTRAPLRSWGAPTLRSEVPPRMAASIAALPAAAPGCCGGGCGGAGPAPFGFGGGGFGAWPLPLALPLPLPAAAGGGGAAGGEPFAAAAASAAGAAVAFPSGIAGGGRGAGGAVGAAGAAGAGGACGAGGAGGGPPFPPLGAVLAAGERGGGWKRSGTGGADARALGTSGRPSPRSKSAWLLWAGRPSVSLGCMNAACVKPGPDALLCGWCTGSTGACLEAEELICWKKSRGVSQAGLSLSATA